MKKARLWILALLFIAGLGGYLFVSRLEGDFMVRRIAEVTQSATGAPLELDAPPMLSAFPPAISFGPARWQGQLAGCDASLSLQGGMAMLELMPLLFGDIVLKQISLDQPKVHIILATPPQEVGNKATAAPSAKVQPDSSKLTPARKAPDDALPLELGRLTVRKGELSLESRDQNIRFSGFNLSLENLRRREETSIEGDLVLEIKGSSGKAESAPPLEGNLAFKGTLRYYAPNLTFRQTSLAFTQLKGPIPRELSPLQLTGEGALDLATLNLKLAQARFSTPQARLSLHGQGTFAPPAFTGEVQLIGSARKLAALAGISPAKDAADELHIKSPLELSKDTLRLGNLTGEAAGTSLGGELALSFPTGQDAPLAIRGALRLGSLALDAQGPAEKALPEKNKPAPAVDKAARATPEDAEAAGALPIIDLRLAIAALRRGAFGLRDLSARIHGRQGRYAISGFSARFSGGGTLKGDLALDMSRKTYSLEGNATGVDLGSLCAATGKAGLASGSASLGLRLKAAGADQSALVASLDGEGELEARDLSFPALRDADFLRDLLALVQLRLPERFDSANAPFTVRQGEITAAPVTLTGTGLAARGEARISLAREFLQGSATVSALGLNIPLLFQGPFSNVSVSVDPKFALQLGRKLGQLPGAAEAAGGAAKDKTGAIIREGLGAAGDAARQLFGR